MHCFHCSHWSVVSLFLSCYVKDSCTPLSMDFVDNSSNGQPVSCELFSDGGTRFSRWKCIPTSAWRCDRDHPGISAATLDKLKGQCWRSRRSRSVGNELSWCTEELGCESTCGAGQRTILDDPAERSAMGSSTPDDAVFADRGSSSLPYNYSFQRACPLTSSGCARRSSRRAADFPEPLPSLLSDDRPVLRPIKSCGRLVLKQVANASPSLFRATRFQGRLRLELVSPTETYPSDSPDHKKRNPLTCFPSEGRSSLLRTLTLPPSCGVYSTCAGPDLHTAKLSMSNNLEHCIDSLASSFKWDLSIRRPSPAISHRSNRRDFSSPHHVADSSPQTNSGASLSRRISQASPRLFAVVDLTSAGFGLIILEFQQSKIEEPFALNAVYTLKNTGFQGVIDDFISQVSLAPRPSCLVDEVPKARLNSRLGREAADLCTC
ncbi:hypothetical protein KP509_20G040000 [Ceratopteris richardii]|uniref:FAF domain-containing protein n=1 Tax=Ceratopteris richardii TaxID=49495 RepID=A0A8T2SI54_CERRI|nr:hypothetical protein KP509_20G040000 [Ceratopteris richardii]